MVPANSYRISRVPHYSGYCYQIKILPVRDYHPLWSLFPKCSSSFLIQISQSYNPKYALLHIWFGLLRFRSPLLAQSLLFSSPKGNEMFQFPSFAFHIRGMTQLHCAGLPHSDITGSMVICTYPMLFAAYHVLLRLPEPRHPPFALCLLFFLYRIAYNWYMHTARCFVFYFFTSLLFSICQRSSFN